MNKSVEIELTTKCTIKCPACPRTYRRKLGDTTWDTGHLDKNIVYKTFDSPNFQNIRFVGSYGDCIYHPDFIEIARRACTLNKKIRFDTNGSHRKPKFWKQLSDLPWNNRKEFRFAIDGLEDTNHIYRKNSVWKDIVMAVETLASGKQKPKLIWQMLVFPYNEHQVEQAKALSKQLGFDEFHYSKSLRKYREKWFENNQERKNIDWNYS
tara:strand:+ start:2631 stop:3257 length:627 start_codon:yes stop_codon:yes gene_type:complete